MTQQQFKIGDKVVIKKEKISYMNNYENDCIKNDSVLKILRIGPEYLQLTTDKVLEIERIFNTQIEKVEFPTETRLKKYEIDLNKKTKELKKYWTEKLKIKHIPLSKRQIEQISDRNELSTTTNFICLYNQGIIKNNNYSLNGIIPQHKYPNACCCSLTKTTSDLVVYIPKSRLTYFGYNQINLNAWISFLKKCDINFEGKLLETNTLKNAFETGVSDVIKFFGGIIQIPYINIDEDCYVVHIPGSKYAMHTYLHFILIRFIYSSLYWNIPFIAMKLKKGMPNLTHWECLLLAHVYEPYSTGYSIVQSNSNGIALPSKFNNQIHLLKYLENINQMINASLKIYKENIDSLREDIKNLNYKNIEKLVKKYRDVN